MSNLPSTKHFLKLHNFAILILKPFGMNISWCTLALSIIHAYEWLFFVQEIAGGFVNKKDDSVSASWGGFHASASLNDDGSAVASAGGNGLGASSGYGAGGAGAGASLFGTAATSGVGSTGAPAKPIGGKPGNAGGSPLYHQGAGAGNGFFDRIFAVSALLVH